MNYHQLSDKELKQLAIDIAEGKVYTSMHFKVSQGTMKGIERAFMPLMLGAGKKMSIPMDDLGLLYEYTDHTTGAMCNGEPVFMSFRYLNNDDTEKLFAHYNAYLDMKDKFTGDG